ncbi:phospholipase A2 inhibitor beta-like [Prorops nasuta]|uniref:phospholipase A2 inhibitor beta-like n=1 Tax=Prorops nasuta TaxID=863751 RepID=UPI0034CEB823
MWLQSLTILLLFNVCLSTNTVNLSNRKITKEDFFTKIQSTIHLSDVTELILSNNEFNSFLDCSTTMENLRTLDLSHNHLQRFFFLCKEEYNLQVLNVSYNQLEYIDDTALTHKIPNLKILDLSWNRLALINETMFEHLKILEFLSLSNNPIGDNIHENAFWTTSALKHLDLRNVSVSHLPAAFFKTLSNLTVLDLSMNPITSVPTLPAALEKLDVSGTRILHLKGLFLPHLRELQLNYMVNLTSFELNDLANMTGLQIFSTTHSKKLKDIHAIYPPSDAQVLLPHLQQLLISNCSLETLGYDLRSVIQRTAKIDLSNNPWRCNCKMQWLNENEGLANIAQEIRCKAPEQHRGKLLSNVPNYELECEDAGTLFYPVLWTCSSLLIASLLVSLGFFLFRRQFGHWSFRRRNQDTVTYTNVVESNNDLVRILADHEAQEQNDVTKVPSILNRSVA